MSETLSPSRMNCLLECPRKHYYKYELGIEKLEKGKALSLGAAWADFKQLFREGVPAEKAIERTVANQKDTTNLNIPMFVAMAAAYNECYGDRDIYSHIYPEVEFDRKMEEVPGDFRAFGRLDAICVARNGEHVINEDKTTSQDIAPGAPYWDRTLFNVQALLYAFEARLKGWDVRRVVYEVSRKPKTERKIVPELDENELKIVICDATGERAVNKNGTPRQTGGDGYTIQGRMETDQEYANRMKSDILSDPTHWFAQQDIWVTDDALEELSAHRYACAKLIVTYREMAAGLAKPAQAWPRNVDSGKCRNMCDFCGFCLQGWSVEDGMLPEGYVFRHRDADERDGAPATA